MKKILLILLIVFVALGVFSCIGDLGDTEETTEQTTAEAAILPETDTFSTTNAKPTPKATTETSAQTTTTVTKTTTEEVAKTTTQAEPMVWIPQSGSKFHSRAGCSNMKNPTQVTLSEAKDLGYTACAKCN